MREVAARRIAPDESPPVFDDPALVAAYLEDASGAAPGRASGLVRPASEAEAAAFIRTSLPLGTALLPQAARSSLTGGAIPAGEVIVSVERLLECGPIETRAPHPRQTVGAGVRLRDLQKRLAGERLYFPPIPTYADALIGGTVATNAGGAASFKYGVTRDWVVGLRVVLFNGDLLVLERGECVVAPGESFRIRLDGGERLEVPAPSYRLPALKKCSAGYHSESSLDLVDLFVGSEGTLGLITAVTAALAPAPAAVLAGLVWLRRAGDALGLAAALRHAAIAARRTNDPRGPDVRAIEWLDRSALDLVRAGGDDRRLRLAIGDAAAGAVTFEIELDCAVSDERAAREFAAAFDGEAGAPDTAITRSARLLRDYASAEDVILALPGDERRRAMLAEFREAAPKRCNERLAELRRADASIVKGRRRPDRALRRSGRDGGSLRARLSRARPRLRDLGPPFGWQPAPQRASA
jgi:D-lactate dehydrogenase (cytochrome)